MSYVKTNRLGPFLTEIGFAVPDHMVIVGKKLGEVFRKVEIRFASFLDGLAKGLGQPINQSLSKLKFDDDIAEDILNALVYLKKDGVSLRWTVEMILIQLEFKLSMFYQLQDENTRNDQALSKMFKETLPAVFKGSPIRIIERQKLLDQFPAVAESIKSDLTKAGTRLGELLKQIYHNLKV
eukprot:TRINITY_DN5483_c0_g1_i4.p1 TRINITY_DN5483_c0_g1~~TRINITY_DN5483_c0_g1_i4.p1  ORF type:complete len:181 (+),score=10.92 TRINITY_DN5483_c0_g1_i4:116-658(+)